MYRRATTQPQVPALWRGKPLARRAITSRLAASRPQIPPLRKSLAGPIKYNPDPVSFRRFTEDALMDAPWLDSIRSHMTCTEFVDSVWGFAVYRCAGTDEKAWNRMIQHIHNSVDETLKLYGHEDLLPHHDLHVVDESPLQHSHGATARQVRDHFHSWVSQSLAGRLPPNSATEIDDLEWTGATSTPRYEYCLFIDTLCLESLDQPGPNFPVVKLLCRDWTDPLSPTGRQNALVYPGFHDGLTEYYEEDVGWMYLPVSEYVDRYARLHDTHGWETTYVRPPYIFGFEEEDGLAGAWRRD